MDDNLKENLQELCKIENKYGLVQFRMGLSHLVDVGIRNLDIASLEECFKQIAEQEEADKADGKISIMTPEFQREIVRCAAELAQFSIWTLFAYIKKYVVVGCEDDKYLLLNHFEREIGIPETYDSLDEAQDAMKAALIDAMDGVDDSVFADFKEGNEYGLESTEAWFNHRHGKHDWKILIQTSSGRIQYA